MTIVFTVASDLQSYISSCFALSTTTNSGNPHQKHATMEGRYVMPDLGTHHMRSASRETPQVTMANDSRLGDDGPGGMMQHEDSIYADANMADASDLYGQGDTLG